MQLQEKLTTFAVLEGSWIVWLLLGFAMGGAGLFFQRVIYLVTHRSRRADRELRGIQTSNPGLSAC